MRILLIYVAVFLVYYWANYVRADVPGCDFPVPDFQISPSSKTGISRAAFERVLNDVERSYRPVFERAGCPLVVHRSWKDGMVNAQAWRSGGECHIEMFGGLARYPGMTQAAFKTVALHEIGHHLAGEPLYRGTVMACEGQADIFAGSSYPSATGALALSRALASLSGEPRPSRPVPALPSVSRTYCPHPAAACRLLTYDAGRLGLARPRCWYSGN